MAVNANAQEILHLIMAALSRAAVASAPFLSE
jgi:hypothetical protein